MFTSCSSSASGYARVVAHNISNRKRSSAVRNSPLDDFQNWLMAVDCRNPQCRRERAYDVAAMARVYPGLTVGQAISRMRCSGCGLPPSTVCVRTKEGLGNRPVEIALVGRDSV